jgi:hypothetical protein
MRRSCTSALLALALVASAATAIPATSAGADDQAQTLALDETFGDHGVATIARTFTDDEGQHVEWPQLVAPDGGDGSYLVMLRHEPTGLHGWTVVHVDASGNRDPGFAGDGTLELPPPFAVPGRLIPTEGGFYLSGAAVEGGGGVFLRRFTSAGVLDPSFAGPGAITDTDTDHRNSGLGVGPDGSVTIGSLTVRLHADSQPWYPYDAELRRFRPDGSVDTSFGGDGSVDITALGATGWQYLMDVDQLGRALVVSSTASVGRSGVARLTRAGALDPSWGSSGNSDQIFSSSVEALSASPGGVSGPAVPVDGLNGISRLDRSGHLDQRVGAHGRAAAGFDVSTGSGYTLALPGGYTAVWRNETPASGSSQILILDDTGAVERSRTLPEQSGGRLFGPGMWTSPDGARLYLPVTRLSGDSHLYAFDLQLRTNVPVASATPGRSSARVSWTAPPELRDTPVHVYLVEAWEGPKLASAWAVADDVRATTLTGLRNGTSYRVTVTPISGHGYAPASEPVLVTPSSSAAAPGPPAAPVISHADTNAPTSMNVAWTPPSSDGGSPVVAYAVVAAREGTTKVAAVELQPADVRAITLTGLARDTAYDLYVFAWSPDGGWGTPAKVTRRTPAQAGLPPAAPLVPWAASAPAGRHLLVAWGAPIDRGARVTGYAIVAVSNGTAVAATTAGPESRSTLLSLPDGVGPVDLYVFAAYADGYGPPAIAADRT